MKMRWPLLASLALLGWCNSLGYAEITGGGFWEPTKGQLVLHVQGVAPATLGGLVLTLGLFYQKQAVMWGQVKLPLAQDNAPIPYHFDFMGFALTQRYALSGPYEVRTALFLSRQPPQRRQHCRQLLTQRAFTSSRHSFYLRNVQQYEKEEQQLLKFYAQRLVFVLFLWNQLQQKSAQAFAVPFATANNNPFVKSTSAQDGKGRLDLPKWRNWLQHHWQVWLTKEQQALQKFRQKFLALRYPELYQHISSCYFLLEQYRDLRTHWVLRHNGYQQLPRALQGLTARRVEYKFYQHLQQCRDHFDFVKSAPYCRQAVQAACKALEYKSVPSFCAFFPFYEQVRPAATEDQ